MSVSGQDILERFQNPGIIFYWPYLLSSLLLTVLFLRVTSWRGWRGLGEQLFDRRVWLTRTTFVDVVISAGYALLLSVPAAAFQVAVFTPLNEFIYVRVFGNGAVNLGLTLPAWLEASLITVVVMLSVDLATYVMHRAMHWLPALWPLHAVHHSAEQLTFFTTHRQHPLEPFLLNAARGAFAAIGTSGFYLIFPRGTPMISVMGLGGGFFLYMFTVNLQHSHVPVRYPRLLRKFLLSPHAHHIHHSVDAQHSGKNYGVIFSLWDRAFGTYEDEPVELGALRFGLAPSEDPFRHSLWRLYLLPFALITSRLLRRRRP